MKTKFKVEGFKELERAMMDLPKATAKGAVRRFLKKALLPVAEAGRDNAPEREGGLKASYGVGTKLTKRQRKLSRRESEVEVYVGADDPAAVQTEFGNEHQDAQPHLRPAWDARRQSVLESIKEYAWAEIEKTVARYKKRQTRKAR